jgi:hypothetical protein
VAPPSRGIKADYRFDQGGLDDLDRLPVLQNIKIAVTPPISLESPEEKHVPDGKRHKALIKHCMKQAHSCDNFEDMLDVARTRNDGYLPPMPDEDVMDIARWAWDHTVTGRNWVGQTGAWLPSAEINSMILNPDALALLMYLLDKHEPNATFRVANGLAATLGWTPKRFAKARAVLEDSRLETFRRYSLKNGPALYRWKRSR